VDRQNVTLSLPKALLKEAKTLAIRKDRSLSDLLRSALEEKVKEIYLRVRPAILRT
jgi:metal-responsive CopG/Arc/MetJ family transcriptional regulator